MNLIAAIYNRKGLPRKCSVRETKKTLAHGFLGKARNPSYLTNDGTRQKKLEQPGMRVMFEDMPSVLLPSVQESDAMGIVANAHFSYAEDDGAIQKGHEESFAIGGSILNKSLMQPKVELSCTVKLKESDDISACPNVTDARYVNLEPSLAMDWLEISWDELQIKERVGAGIYFF